MDEDEERLREIIKIAEKLGWIKPQNVGYPTMQLSEVEKCMLAMINDYDLQRMRKWFEDECKKKTNSQSNENKKEGK